MKIAIVYNRESKNVINLFGQPNREKYGLKAIKRITDALKQGGHQVLALEGDKELIDNLQDFMPRALKNERPGMVFNLSYGIQGQARYTHVPGILEMIGIPYVGSGPVAHSLALDKVVAKVMFQQHGVRTPGWAVLEEPDFEAPDLEYPLIVKPRSESVSFGIKIVHDESELRAAAGVIFDQFSQPVLVEQYIEGREINVGILGNGDHPQTFPPAELDFGTEGERIYTEADKKGKSGRKVTVVCPASLTDEQTKAAEELARGAFKALGCYDCARIDLRMDRDGRFYVLEINSLPSLGEHGSYVNAAEAAGLDFAALVNRLVEVASTRYFGTPSPPHMEAKTKTATDQAFAFLSRRRDQIEKRVQTWVAESSRTNDPIGINAVATAFDAKLRDAGLRRRSEFTDPRHAWVWESEAGFDDGTLLVVHLDVPLSGEVATQHFRRDPEWLYGEGVASSRAPMAMLEFALRALRAKRLKKLRLGVLAYSDEGSDCRYSQDTIRKVAGMAGRVLVLRPGNAGDTVITQRRGQRRLRLRVDGPSRRPGQSGKRPDPLQWFCTKVGDVAALSSRKQRITVAPVDVRTHHLPMLLPHRVDATMLITYPDIKTADEIQAEIRTRLSGDHARWSLEVDADRPPMREGKLNAALYKEIEEVGTKWDIPLCSDSSLWPSVGGLVSSAVPVLCGLGPVAHGVNTADEAVNRVSLIQRTLLLAEFLAREPNV